MRIALLSALAVLTAAPALAETSTAPILAFDRKANIIVLEDKTVWTLDGATEVPEGLERGGVVTMTYAAIGDEGLGKVTKVALAQWAAPGASLHAGVTRAFDCGVSPRRSARRSDSAAIWACQSASTVAVDNVHEKCTLSEVS